MLTISEMMKAAQACQTKEEAQELVKVVVNEILTLRPQLLEEEARTIALSNIGYMTGYLDRAEAGRILKLFEARHPYFGAIEDWPKTPEEAIAMGYQLGQRLERERG